jgi:hypothetical protein
MGDYSDSKYTSRASIGSGASLGVVVGALIAHWAFGSHLSVIIGSIIGGGIGAAIGSRLKSQMSQFFWVEYPGEIGKKIVLASIPFFLTFLPFIFLVKADAGKTILTILLAATSISSFILIFSLGRVIMQLDDVLKGILLEAFGIGFGLAVFVTLTLGLVNLIYPILSDWLVTAVIIMGCALVGRIAVAWKYK